jgi:hypothetical protein
MTHGYQLLPISVRPTHTTRSLEVSALDQGISGLEISGLSGVDFDRFRTRAPARFLSPLCGGGFRYKMNFRTVGVGLIPRV